MWINDKNMTPALRRYAENRKFKLTKVNLNILHEVSHSKKVITDENDYLSYFHIAKFPAKLELNIKGKVVMFKEHSVYALHQILQYYVLDDIERLMNLLSIKDNTYTRQSNRKIQRPTYWPYISSILLYSSIKLLHEANPTLQNKLDSTAGKYITDLHFSATDYTTILTLIREFQRVEDGLENSVSLKEIVNPIFNLYGRTVDSKQDYSIEIPLNDIRIVKQNNKLVDIHENILKNLHTLF